MLDSDEDTLEYIKVLLDNTKLYKFGLIKTEISQDELHIKCDDGTIYKLTIRS